MTELVLTKTPTGGIAPADETTQEFMRSLRVGASIRGDFKRMRNPRFHRKMFALFKFAFDLWEAPELEYKGQRVAKEFDRFRKDLTVLAGHYEATVNLRGEVRLEAKSLSFGAMDEAEFERVYRSILDVVWDKVLKHHGFIDAVAADYAVEELLRFDS